MSTLKEHQEVLFELLEEFDRVCRKHNIRYVVFAGTALGAVRHHDFIPWDDDLDVALLREDYEKLMQIDDLEWQDEYYLQREYSEHWPIHFSKLRKNHTTCLEKYHPKDNKTHQGIYIDIFPIDNASDNPLIRKLQFFASKIVQAKSFWLRGYETTSILKKAVMLLSGVLPLQLFHNMVTLRRNKDTKMVHSFLAGSIRYEKGIFERKWITDTVNIPFNNMKVPVSSYYHDLLTMQYGDYMSLPQEEERRCKTHAILVDTERDYVDYSHYRDNMTFGVLTKSIR